MQVKHPNDPASDQQIGFLRSLVDGREIEEKWRVVAINKIAAGITKGEASKIIDWFNQQPRKRVQVGTPIPAKFQSTPVALAKGVYETSSGDVYAVKVAKTTGRPYAMKWNGTLYQYSAGFYSALVTGNPVPMSLDKAAAMGINSGFCVICGLALTDEKSLTKGIGPVCEKNQRKLVAQP